MYLHIKTKRINMSLSKREENTLKRRIADFILQGKAKYGENAYDYSMVHEEYVNNRTPVHIKCKRCDNDPFPVYPFAHISKGDNQKGTCQHCYVPKQTVQETRWDPNLPKRIKEFKAQVTEKYPTGYSYPYLESEYKNENSDITVICTRCDSKPYKRKARALKSKSRQGGCKVCNQAAMAEKIAQKNKERQKRNLQTQDDPREHGCIYQITNTKNGKFYIGYTTMGAKKRFKAHLDESVKLARGDKKAKSYLHNAMNHHGHRHFRVEMLEEFRNISPRKLAMIEKQYIARRTPDYNVSPGGELGHYKNVKKPG